MKKILAILAVALFGVGTALADTGIEYEAGTQKGRTAENNWASKVRENYVAVTPHTDFGSFGVGVKFEGSRDQTTGSNLSNLMELQVEHDVVSFGPVSTAIKVGLGRAFNQQDGTGANGDFTYYMIQPQAKFAFTPQFAGTVSYRYRNAINNDKDNLYFESNTAKVGVEYKLNKHYEFGLRWVDKFGLQEHAKGVEGGVNYNF
jgi:predicted porin